MWKCPKCGRSFSREGQGHYCGKIETVDMKWENRSDKSHTVSLSQKRKESLIERIAKWCYEEHGK